MAKSRSYLFLFLLISVSSTIFFLIFNHRMPRGHDTWQYLTLQYYFTNEVVNYGKIPEWMPFMTHGAVSNWWFAVQSSVMEFVYFDFGSWISKINFLPLGYLSLFFEEVILLTGIWLLCEKFYESIYTTFFVSAAVALSTIWIDQVWWNFHIFYFIPLTLILIHRAIDQKSFLYATLAGNFLLFSLLGNMPYLLPISTGLICFYFLTYFVLNVDDSQKKLKNLRSSWKWAVCIGIPCITLVYIYMIISSGTQEIVNLNIGRDVSGKSSLDGFLTYGGQTTLAKFHEIITGLSLNIDQTLYAGTLVAPMIVIAMLKNLNRKCLHILILTIVLILFGSGSSSFISQSFFYLFPKASYFRHIGLLGSCSKIFFCLLAGFGFDYLVRHSLRQREKLLFATILLGLGLFSFLQWKFPAFSIAKLSQMGGVTATDLFFSLNSKNVPFRQITIGILFSMGALIVLISLFIKNRKFLVMSLCIIHWFDVMAYRSNLFDLKTILIDENVSSLFSFQKIPYSPRRILDYSTNQRFQTLRPIMFSKTQTFPDGTIYQGMQGDYGAMSWWVENFLFVDSVQSPYRTDHWLKALNDMMSVYWKWPYENSHPGSSEVKMYFPTFEIPKSLFATEYPSKLYRFNRTLQAGDTGEMERIARMAVSENQDILVTSPLDSFVAPLSSRIASEDLLNGVKPNIAEPWFEYRGAWNPFWEITQQNKKIVVDFATTHDECSINCPKALPYSRAFQISQSEKNFTFVRQKIHPSLRKIAGIDRDKIQIFSSAVLTRDYSTAYKDVALPDYNGDTIVVSDSKIVDNFRPMNSADYLNQIDHVINYSSNRIDIDVPQHLNAKSWLMYSDTWHPYWTARVNGIEKSVYRANLGYKAVELEANSHNVVTFEFKNRIFEICTLIARINAHVIFIAVCLLALRIMNFKGIWIVFKRRAVSK